MQFNQIKNHLEAIKAEMFKMTFLQVKIDTLYEEPIELFLRSKTILVGKNCVYTYDRDGDWNGTETTFTFAVETPDEAAKVKGHIWNMQRDAIFNDVNYDEVW